MAEIAKDLAEDIGKIFSGGCDAAGSSGEPGSSSDEPVRYEFDASFQTKIAALVLRDSVFNERTHGLILPEYFENYAESVLVSIALRYFDQYRRSPDAAILIKLLKEAIASKVIRADLKEEVAEKYKQLRREDISDRDYVADQCGEFARHQAMERAILSSVELLQKRQFDKIEQAYKKALNVSLNRSAEYDYFAKIEDRTHLRLEELAGSIKPTGIPTGVPAMDKLLYHKGWGRQELSVYLGGAKSGKTTALINSGLSAALSGYNVLHVTLEVSRDILASRADANLASMTMNDIRHQPHTCADQIKLIRDSGKKIGLFRIHEFPSGSLKPADLRRLLEHYAAQSVKFDLAIIDYLDLMAPNFRTNEPIENSRSVWVDCRAIAQEYDLALLSATQTNRDGYKSSTAKAEHVAEDFNKVRTADLMISINKTEEEERRNEARLFFAASRNQAGGFSIHIKQDLERMKFVTAVLGTS